MSQRLRCSPPPASDLPFANRKNAHIKRAFVGKPITSLGRIDPVAFTQVDISKKPVIFRLATAVGKIRLSESTIARIREGRIDKGDPISLARLTAVTGAKQTSSLLSLCHPLRIETTGTRAELMKDGVQVSVTVAAHEKTGVEMEALTGVAIALLNIWDVVKQYEKDSNGQYPDTRIEFIRVERKVKKPDESA
jgi:cyclic pyranopterin phosphate synthase